MARESKKAREAREAEERAAARNAAECVWHLSEGVWRRRRGVWWLRVEQHTKSYSRELAWEAALQCGHGWSGSIMRSKQLGDVATADLDVVRAAADAWLVEVTAPLMQLVADGVPAKQPDEVTP